MRTGSPPVVQSHCATTLRWRWKCGCARADAGIEHRPRDALPARAVAEVGGLRLHRLGRLVQERALHRVAPHALDLQLAAGRAQALDLLAREVRGEEALHVLDARRAGRRPAFLQEPGDRRLDLAARFLERGARERSGVRGQELDQRGVAVRGRAVLDIRDQVLHHDAAADDVGERRAGRPAHLVPHFRDAQVPRRGMRVGLPFRVELQAPGVLDLHAGGVRGEVAPEVGVERHGVEPLGEVDPAVHALGHRERPPLPELVLDFLQAEGGAQRHEEAHVALALRELAQHLVGDHRPLAVADHDEGTPEPVEALADGELHAAALALHVQEVAHVLEEEAREELRGPPSHAFRQGQHLRAWTGATFPERSPQARLEALERLLLLARERGAGVPALAEGANAEGLALSGEVVAARAGARLRRRIVLAVHPVAHSRAVAHGRAEERGVPLALEHRGLRLVADAVHVDDRAHLRRLALGGQSPEERRLLLPQRLRDLRHADRPGSRQPANLRQLRRRLALARDHGLHPSREAAPPAPTGASGPPEAMNIC